MKTVIKQSVLFIVFISAILNFEIINDWIKLSTSTNKFKELGGYISRPILWILNNMFGGQANAIKILIIILFILLIIWILYSRNISLPKVQLKSYERPKINTKQTEQKKGGKSKITHYTNNTQNKKDETPSSETQQKSTNKMMKTIIQQKISQKEKELEIKKRPKIHFSGDKPTFSENLIQKGQGKVALPEKFLIEKSDGLQKKLTEFNVPVTVEGFDIGPSIIQLKVKPNT